MSQWIKQSETETVAEEDKVTTHEAVPVETPKRFGFDTTQFKITDASLKSGETLGALFLSVGFSHIQVHNIVQAAEGVFDARYVKVGEAYHWVYNKSRDSLPSHLIYEKSPLVYYQFDLNDTLKVVRHEKETSIRVDTATTIVRSSLYQDLRNEGVPVQVIMHLADVYGWVIDFFRIQKGDYIKLTYELKVVDDTAVVGYGKIPSALFYHGGKELFAFYYQNEDDTYRGYFNEDGDAMRKAFLKAPLDFFRISSRYNPKRFHPVLKKMKPHLGTDYAAPTGTPIRTTADGVIEKMGYTSGNGNFVKVRHNSTYSTQYLHMSKFAQGMKNGKHVSQGDVIGYVGSTGLATGPHVCYRFWKNGVQVDPLKEELPSAEPIDENERQNFFRVMEVRKEALLRLTLPQSNV
ncbi:MAG: peptidoglycan DD-metalloendopeptidase family protein [Cryomorphaceae bacterium]|nr:peptidoglycan DD-metalloendopeptidase family protein [Cryomorphaceae bacterium]